MAYQRFGEDSDLYIWTGFDSLNIWTTHKPTTNTVAVDDGAVNIKFTRENVDEAVTLFRALYDHLVSNGAIVEINKKHNQLKIRRGKNNV